MAHVLIIGRVRRYYNSVMSLLKFIDFVVSFGGNSILKFQIKVDERVIRPK